MTIALMYHALYADDTGLEQIDVEDRPYAVSVDNFRAQLKVLQDYRCGLLGAGDSAPEIVLTFDDGHASNAELALPLLLEAGIPAYFFITTDFIESRPHFCSWAQLRTMADAGMIIGSHGKTHRFFADLSVREAEAELLTSKTAIEQAIGQRVASISFPGGRYSSKTLELARFTGYSQLFGSGFGKIGANSESDEAMLSAEPQALNRLAIRRGTGLAEFQRMVAGDSRYFAVQSVKSVTKNLVKRVLGNNRYHALYKFIASR